MDTFNSDVLERIAVAVDLANAHAAGSLSGGVHARPEWIFETHHYATPENADDWTSVAQLAEQLDNLLRRVAAGDHDTVIELVNNYLAESSVTPYIENGPNGYVLHFHTRATSFADGWAGGIYTALAVAYSTGQASRIGRCASRSCERLFLDRGRNQQRRFCSLQCQNREKSAAYRRVRTRA
ncbi:CGNR zinc finger domain-containing protein [Rhodococcus sp. IEGM 1381]|uniref:CGNR zinc finger domain-containing protein n=1 Tax=Rhodococcus sp. IEGM 1381 TaxID=3047085 RepID=UPI0024B75563|nr:CGNR zinc finger domain-containing protein [Rhodococcus sp. IEGM 1381]MDI9893335.1 CGNR zinc finger domain-containing protein [Rhodococcus sp. IEGM 1381]